MECLGEGNKKSFITLMQRMAQLRARSEREDPKSQDLKLAQVGSSNKKVTLSAPLAEE